MTPASDGTRGLERRDEGKLVLQRCFQVAARTVIEGKGKIRVSGDRCRTSAAHRCRADDKQWRDMAGSRNTVSISARA